MSCTNNATEVTVTATSTNAVSIPITDDDEKQPKKNCNHLWLLHWLKVCSYSSNMLHTIFIALCMVGFAGYEYYTIYKQWYNHIVAPAYIFTLVTIFGVLHRNLRNKEMLVHLLSIHNDTEFYTVLISSLCALTVIAIIPYTLDGHLCGTTVVHIISGVGTFCINLMTIFTLNIVVLSLSLCTVGKYRSLMAQLDANMHVNKIRQHLQVIQQEIRWLRSKWELAVSVSCAYHLLYGVVYGLVWLLNVDNDVYAQCDSNHQFLSIVLIMSKICVRLFGLFYGVLRLNSIPERFAMVMNNECNWDDATQQFQIQRIIQTQTQFQDTFNVCGIGLRWRHFIGIIVSATAASLGALFRVKFG